MAQFFGQDGTADGTGLITAAVGLGTFGMTKCGYLGVGVGIAATRASVGGVTLLGTGRYGDHSLVPFRIFFTSVIILSPYQKLKYIDMI